MPIALLGGTFDPIHKGHLAIAQAALDARRFGLERVIFIPADIPPHKLEQAITPYEDRFAMVELALKGHPNFEASRIEDPAETKGQPNYSINTIRRFKREHGLSSEGLYFIVGVDSYAQLETWREPEAIKAECRLIVVSRPGFDDEMTEAMKDAVILGTVNLLETVCVDVSSSQIRAAVASGEPLEKYVVPVVADYIRGHNLYR